MSYYNSESLKTIYGLNHNILGIERLFAPYFYDERVISSFKNLFYPLEDFDCLNIGGIYLSEHSWTKKPTGSSSFP